MSFSLWHWLIVTAIAAIAFRRQVASLYLYFTDPGRAVRTRLGQLNEKDRETIARNQAKMRRNAWIIVAAAFVLIFAWKASRYLTG